MLCVSVCVCVRGYQDPHATWLSVFCICFWCELRECEATNWTPLDTRYYIPDTRYYIPETTTS